MAGKIEDARTGSALIIAIAGLAIIAGLMVYFERRGHSVNEITAMVGLFTGLVGTLVGTFLGVQVASAGREKAEAGREKAEGIAQRALAELPVAQARSVLGQQ